MAYDDITMPRKNQAVYRIGRIVYVPHYRNEYTFVGPGFPHHDPRRWFAGELLARGAIKDHMPLWERRGRDQIN
jgi:hypothetical protein